MSDQLFIKGHFGGEFRDFAHASQIYRTACEESGEGASTFPTGYIARRVNVPGRGPFEFYAFISYNGRVWDSYRNELLYCPASAGQDEGMPGVFNAGRESVWGRKCDNPHPTGSVQHTVFERGAEFARSCYA